MSKIILATHSPRRIELFSRLGLRFETEEADIEESFLPRFTAEENSKRIAMSKAENVFQRHSDENSIVIGADTVVVIDNKVLTKPKTREDAYLMIALLSGRMHEVFGGYAIISEDKRISFVEKTKVFVREMKDEEILNYIETGEPYDKAGGYGIQSLFSVFIEKIDGCYYNVVGLSLHRIYEALTGEFNLRIQF